MRTSIHVGTLVETVLEPQKFPDACAPDILKPVLLLQ